MRCGAGEDGGQRAAAAAGCWLLAAGCCCCFTWRRSPSISARTAPAAVTTAAHAASASASSAAALAASFSARAIPSCKATGTGRGTGAGAGAGKTVVHISEYQLKVQTHWHAAHRPAVYTTPHSASKRCLEQAPGAPQAIEYSTYRTSNALHCALTDSSGRCPGWASSISASIAAYSPAEIASLFECFPYVYPKPVLAK